MNIKSYGEVGGGSRRVETKARFGGRWLVGSVRGLVRELDIGLMIMSDRLLVMEKVLYFGTIIGLGTYRQD